MGSEPLRQLANSLYYAPLPALAIDREGQVEDYNLALEVLVGEDLNGCRNLPLSDLMQTLGGRVIEGEFVPQAGAMECLFDSEDLGLVRLTPSVVFCQEETSGESLGRVVTWTVAAPDGGDRFHDRYRAVLDHQLTWDTYAWSYDRILTLMPYYQETVARHLEAMRAAGSGPVLDLGAGTGNLVERLIAEGRIVTAIDNSRPMLDKLRAKPALATAVTTGSLNIIEANAETLPMVGDGTFAGVNILLTLFDMQAPDAGLETAVRLLRPGGILAITELRRDFRLDPILEQCEHHLKRLGCYKELEADLRRVARSNRELAPGSRSHLRAENVFDRLARARFEELRLIDSHFGQCATVIGCKPDLPKSPR